MSDRIMSAEPDASRRVTVIFEWLDRSLGKRQRETTVFVHDNDFIINEGRNFITITAMQGAPTITQEQIDD